MKTIQLKSSPVRSIRGEITVPGDKSISHRAILFGSLAKGITIISGFLEGEDCLATVNAFKAMGVIIEGPIKQRIVIYGVGKHGLKKPDHPIDCGNSGTSMRLMAGILAAQSFDSELTGDESLLKRPMLRVSDPLTQMGATLTTMAGKPPIQIHGGRTLTGINYLMPEASAQVKSCLLLAGLYAQGQTSITETGVSRDHTERMLHAFSYPILKSGTTLTVDNASECEATDLTIPGDFSSAAFFIVAATINPGSDIIIRDVGINPTRIGLIHILKEMGADIDLLNQRQFGEEPVADLHVKYAALKGINIPSSMVSLTIDEFPVLFIAAAHAQGETLLHGAKELRLKESDRIGAMVDGLVQLGIQATGFDDGIQIIGGKMQEGIVESRGDHRIAMSFAVAGTVASGPVTILDCANIGTSFPGFVETANGLHFCIEDLNDND